MVEVPESIRFAKSKKEKEDPMAIEQLALSKRHPSKTPGQELLTTSGAVWKPGRWRWLKSPLEMAQWLVILGDFECSSSLRG